MTHTTTEKLFHQLHHSMNLLHRGHGHHKGRGGHSAHRGQGRIVSLLREKDGLNQRELGEMLHIQPPSLSEVLTKLEEGGLIERRQNEADKRMSNVFLTEKGHEAATQVESARKGMAEELLSGFSQEDQEQLSTLLDRLTTTLEAKVTDMAGHRGGHGACRVHGGHHGQHAHHHYHEGHPECCGHKHHGNGCQHGHHRHNASEGGHGENHE